MKIICVLIIIIIVIIIKIIIKYSSLKMELKGHFMRIGYYLVDFPPFFTME